MKNPPTPLPHEPDILQIICKSVSFLDDSRIAIVPSHLPLMSDCCANWMMVLTVFSHENLLAFTKPFDTSVEQSVLSAFRNCLIVSLISSTW